MAGSQYGVPVLGIGVHGGGSWIDVTSRLHAEMYGNGVSEMFCCLIARYPDLKASERNDMP